MKTVEIYHEELPPFNFDQNQPVAGYLAAFMNNFMTPEQIDKLYYLMFGEFTDLPTVTAALYCASRMSIADVGQVMDDLEIERPRIGFWCDPSDDHDQEFTAAHLRVYGNELYQDPPIEIRRTA